MTSILWFRRDLRLRDNPALGAAARSASDGVLGVFVLDPALLHASGSPRLAYLARSLAALDESMGGRLVVRRGDPAQVIPALARELDADVHVAAGYEPYGRARDERVARALEGAGRALVRTGSPYAVAPGRLRTRGGTPFQVFTPFRGAWLDHGWRRPAPDVPVRWLTAPGDGLPAAPDVDVRLPEAGAKAASRRWEEFRADGLAEYAGARDVPGVDGTSRLSIALKWGEIHPRTLLADVGELLASGRALGDGPATFRSELAWREFHADVLFHHPGARTTSLREVVPADAWASGPGADDAFAAWAAGRTGYPIVDAGMRQLAASGWMHNRVRMVTASFLVKDLHLPWQRGAAHFMAHLLDGDTAQNQLNWQWVAGTGRDAAPFFRIFNPTTQGTTFDPDGAYVRRWVPELAGVPAARVHEPWRLEQQPQGYPAPMVDHAEERHVALADMERGRAGS
ncbi:MAG: cryptochrome/photolyase family protein [Cellulomonadaceae bacterium]